jgi:hypothetical protein
MTTTENFTLHGGCDCCGCDHVQAVTVTVTACRPVPEARLLAAANLSKESALHHHSIGGGGSQRAGSVHGGAQAAGGGASRHSSPPGTYLPLLAPTSICW